VAKTRLGFTMQQLADRLQPFVGLPFLGLRDGFLVIGACLYFLGYILWALYAALEHLGNLPLLSAQYLTAGTIVAGFLAVAWILGRGLWWIRASIARGCDSTIEWRLTLVWSLQIVSMLAFFAAVASTQFGNNDYIMLFGIYVFAFTAFFAPELKKQPAWADRVADWLSERPYLSPATLILQPSGFAGLGILYGWLFTAVLPLVAIAAAFLLFVNVPQELGGPRPSCTLLDLDRTMMSAQTQEDLTPNVETQSLRVARSIPVDMLFSGGESVLVRRHVRSSRKDLQVYEINPKMIMSKLECD
jgi:hypothetical protein